MKTVKIICTAFAIGALGLDTVQAQENRMDYNTYNSNTHTASVYSGDMVNEKHDRHSKIGLKGGLNLSNLMFEEDVNNENVKEGYHFGVYSKMNIAGPVSIQPELMYSRKGAEVSYDRIDLDNVDYTLDYIDLPVMLRVDIGGLNLNAGGYASYLMDAEVKAEDMRGNQVLTELDEDGFNSFDYGLVGGIGLEWKALDMGVRYNYGLRDVGTRGDADPTNPLENGRNSVAQFFIGVGL